jgi:hypothetical protein
MNKFDTNPEELFSGSLRWYGIKDPAVKVFKDMTELERHNAVMGWPAILTEKSSRGAQFSAHLFKQLVVCDSTVLDTVRLEQDAVKLRFERNRFEEWLPDDQREHAWLGRGYRAEGTWSLIGVAEHVVLSAFAKQFSVPSLTYGAGELDTVTMHIKPFVPEVAARIAEAVR